MQRISNVNGLQEISSLVVGQALVIPSTERPYTVQAGESLWAVARKFNVSVNSLAALNGIAPPYGVYPGMTLRIPELAKNYGFICRIYCAKKKRLKR